MNESIIKTSVFWSYNHIDNEAENNLILELAKSIQNEYRVISGEDLEIIIDNSVLPWGEDWRKVLDSELSSAQFLVSIITPNYLRSYECCREIKHFTERAESLGAEELFLPLIYVDVPEITDSDIDVCDSIDPEIVQIIKKFQYEKWIELRFEDPGTGKYRAGVHKLAQRLYDANKRIDTKLTAFDLKLTNQETLYNMGGEKAASNSDIENDDDTGLIESSIEIEEQFAEITNTIESIGRNIELVGQATAKSTERIAKKSAQGAKSSAFLVEFNKLAKELNDPAEQIFEGSKLYADQIDSIDSDVTTVITQTKRLNKEGNEDFYKSILTMAETSETTVSQTLGMKDSVVSVIGISRELNKPLRKIQSGLDIFISATNIILKWRDLVLVEDQQQ